MVAATFYLLWGKGLNKLHNYERFKHAANIVLRIDKENDRRINLEEFVACKGKMEKVKTTFIIFFC